MTFLYPLGLLGLIGIPILIIIYIIKSKYMEQTVSSTYLWTLSERFIKRKNPISKLAGIISLILQLLIVAIISVSIAHPIISIPDSANEYCFILDASGSMNMEAEGKTRFEAGKEKIASTIDSATNGSIYSLIYVGDTTSVVFEKTDNKEVATLLLSELKPAYDDTDTADAIRIAQGYFNENPSLKAYFVTDKFFTINNNITIQNVSKNESNCAIKDASYTLTNGELSVIGSAVSYGGASPLTFKLYVNDEEAPRAEAGFLVTEKSSKFNLSCKDVDSVSKIKIVFSEEDSLSLDNEYVIFNQKSENSYKTLLVSDEPFFVRSAVEAILNTKIDVLTTKEYLENKVSGYGLYIFDSFNPGELPKDGTVWLMNMDSSIEKSGFSVQGAQELAEGVELELSKDSSSTTKKLIKDMLGDDIYVAGEFMKYGLYRSFTSVLTYQGNSLVFAGTNDLGNRQVVFAFDLNNSNIALKSDYLVLMRNLIDFSFPEVVEKTSYHCGEDVEINVLANCDSIKVESPFQNVSYLDAGSAVATLKLTEVGEYTVTMQIGDNQRVIKLYSAMNENERAPLSHQDEIQLTGEAREGGFDGKYDPLTILFIALIVVFLADWMVYCYEKCKLR